MVYGRRPYRILKDLTNYFVVRSKSLQNKKERKGEGVEVVKPGLRKRISTMYGGQQKSMA
jgi:hypothetical protein